MRYAGVAVKVPDLVVNDGGSILYVFRCLFRAFGVAWGWVRVVPICSWPSTTVGPVAPYSKECGGIVSVLVVRLYDRLVGDVFLGCYVLSTVFVDWRSFLS